MNRVDLAAGHLQTGSICLLRCACAALEVLFSSHLKAFYCRSPHAARHSCTRICFRRSVYVMGILSFVYSVQSHEGVLARNGRQCIVLTCLAGSHIHQRAHTLTRDWWNGCTRDAFATYRKCLVLLIYYVALIEYQTYQLQFQFYLASVRCTASRAPLHSRERHAISTEDPPSIPLLYHALPSLAAQRELELSMIVVGWPPPRTQPLPLEDSCTQGPGF